MIPAGTSACPNALFHCINHGHIGSDIKSSRVNDGLCEPECCDGSDEPSGVCPNLCGPVGEKYRATMEAERKLRKTGSKLRSSYILFAQKEKTRLEASIERLKQDVAGKRDEEARLRGTYLATYHALHAHYRSTEIWEHTESMDAAMLDLRKQSRSYSHCPIWLHDLLDDLATFHLLNNHTSLLEALSKREDKLKERVKELETILETLTGGYNPNYQDMAVLEAVRGWEALKPSEEEDENSEEEIDNWSEDRIDELRNADPLSSLLEHERHVKGTAADDFTSLRELLVPTLESSSIISYSLYTRELRAGRIPVHIRLCDQYLLCYSG